MASFGAHAAPEILRIGSYNLSVQRRLAEGGFGLVDLVLDNVTRYLLHGRASTTDTRILTAMQVRARTQALFASDLRELRYR